MSDAVRLFFLLSILSTASTTAWSQASGQSSEAETGPPAIPSFSPSDSQVPGLSELRQTPSSKITIESPSDESPSDESVTRQIRTPLPSDRVTIGRAEGLAEFRDSLRMVPDAFSRLDSSYSYPHDSENTPSPIIPETSITESGSVSSSSGARSDSGDCTVDSLTLTDKRTRESRSANVASTAVFGNAAHFAFGSNGGCQGLSHANPVMIYEGMTVRLSDSGAYEVRLVAEAPDLPVVLRMQLNLQQQGVPIGTITLPPVVLASSESESVSRRTRLPNETRSWLIRRTGYSHAVAGLTSQDRQRITVTRTGTVQIGHIPQKSGGY